MHEKHIQEISIGSIVRPIPPIRENFDDAQLHRLTQSIRENGIIAPLVVRPKGDQYEIVDGDRRLAAAFNAGLRQIPVVVRDLSDRDTHIQRMLANLDRDDTDPVSEAKYVARLIHEGTFTAEEYAEKLGRSLSWVADRLAIAEMPDYMQEALSQKQISLGVCLEYSQIHDEATMRRYFIDAVRSGITVHSAHINRLTVNEAIDSLHQQGEEVTEESVPAARAIPKVRCELTAQMLPVSATRMIRVGIDNFEAYKKELGM